LGREKEGRHSVEETAKTVQREKETVSSQRWQLSAELSGARKIQFPIAIAAFFTWQDGTGDAEDGKHA